MTMRRGMTLVEVLVVTITLPFFAIAFDTLFRSMLSDIPRSNRLVQENTSLLAMLEQMRKDVSVARALPESFAQYKMDDGALLIELAGRVFCYRLEDGKMVRRTLSETQQGQVEDTRVWSLPNSMVQWRIWRKDGSGYAVEVSTAIRYKLRSKYQQRMANSYLYFLGTI